MGIFDILKRKKDEKRVDEEVVGKATVQNIDNPMGNLTMTYSSGIEASVYFKGMIEYNKKHLEEVIVWYGQAGKEDAVSIGKRFLLEPHIGKDSSGNLVYDTEAYYKSLCENGRKGAVKGFFQKEQAGMRETDYLGLLEFAPDGKAIRKEDHDFLDNYRGIYKILQDAKKQEKIKRESDFRKTIAEQVKKIPEAVDNPEDHVQLLNPEMLKNMDQDLKDEKEFDRISKLKDNSGVER